MRNAEGSLKPAPPAAGTVVAVWVGVGVEGWLEAAVDWTGWGAGGAAGVSVVVEGAGVEGPPDLAAGAAFGLKTLDQSVVVQGGWMTNL